MPPHRTPAQILQQLNGERIGETWMEMPGFVSLPVTAVNGAQQISLSLSSAAVLKAFYNLQTAEVRIYLAKRLDVPESDKL